jgi:hypothetical protein
MVKRMTISFSDFCYENYLSETQHNRSKYVESLVIKGAESMLENTNETKSKYLKLLQENNNLSGEIKNLQFELNKRKEDKTARMIERDRKIARIKGIQASGALSDE